MKFRNLLLISFTFLPVIMNAQKKEIVAFFPEWRGKGEHPYYVKDIEKRNSADKITVLNYAFIIPGPDSTGKIIPQFIDTNLAYLQQYKQEISIDGVADDSSQVLRGQFNQLKKLKQRHQNLKILLSLGGWEGSRYFSDAALTPASREVFVSACIDRFINGNLPLINGAGGKGSAAGIFDGFDIDWEYPVKGGAEIHHNHDDNSNLSKLIALFRSKLDSINPAYILTETVPAIEKYARYYNIYHDQQYLDWYNLTTYDFHGSWDTATGHNSNLLSPPVDTTAEGEVNSFDKTVRLFNCIYGVSKSKLVPGAAFFGKGWKDVDTANYGLGMKGSVAKSLTEGGYNYFSDLTDLLRKGFKLHWDNNTMAPYLYNPEKKIFWTFDNAKSIALKALYVDTYDLRGIMFWEITGDDSLGTLVNTIYTRKMPEVKIKPDKKKISLPEIKITSPLPSDWINSGTNVVIETESFDTAGAIVKVEYVGDRKSLGYDIEAPFSWVWFNIPEGDHTIKVIAYDNNGRKKESQQVKLLVRKR
jgi:chitinase